MKIRGEVLSVETDGDKLRVRLQGAAQKMAEWRSLLSIRIEVPDVVKNRRTYYVGRIVYIEVKAGNS
jgi:hypothetical protein